MQARFLAARLQDNTSYQQNKTKQKQTQFQRKNYQFLQDQQGKSKCGAMYNQLLKLF